LNEIVKVGNFSQSKKSDFPLNIIKIIIIVFVSFSLLANFEPFYGEKDVPHRFGLISMHLANGVYSISNELLQNTGNNEFVGQNWLKTTENTAVPVQGPALGLVGSVFFLVGGYYGLFYLSPIFAILLLISSERITTNLFGKYVGFLTLLFLATSNLLFRNSVRLQAEALFSFIILFGFYFLIKYFKTGKEKNILFCSILFVFSTLIRLNGAMFLPLEIFILVGYFLIQKYRGNKKTYDLRTYLKIGIYITIPWLIAISGFLIYNEHYFGEPVVTHLEIQGSQSYESNPISLIQFDGYKFENVKAYSKYLLPYQIPAIYNKSDQKFDEIFGTDWIGMVSLLILILSLLFSLYYKKKRKEMLILFILIVGNVWFFSAITSEARAANGVAARYMIPFFVYYSMMLSFIIIEGLGTNISKTQVGKSIKILKFVFVGILVIFFVGAFFYSNPVQIIAENGIDFKNPESYAARYPLDKEGLTEISIILAKRSDFVIDYGVIPIELRNIDSWSEERFQFLNDLNEKKYEIYIFKEPTKKDEKEILKFMTEEYNIVLKDYSESFCKVEFSDSADLTSDEICLKDEEQK